MTDQEIVKHMGFEICEFGPDSQHCEGCIESNLQLYYQGFDGDGRYLCLACILLEHSDNQRQLDEILKLEKEGHSNHCACRLVWGDGECECQKIIKTLA